MDAKSSYTFDITVKDQNSTDDDVMGFAGVIEQTAEEKADKNGTGKVKTEIINTRLRIVSCSRQGQMQVKIIGEKKTSMLIKSITNESFAITITSQNNTKVPYSIINKDSSKRMVQLQLYFLEELMVSSLSV